MASTVNIPTSAGGYRQSIVSQAQQAQRQVNRMQMSPTLNHRGFTQPLGRITNSASEFQKSMDASAARVFAFGAAVGIINGVSDAFKALVASAAEVEKALKDVQVVMDVSNSTIKQFGQGIFDVARNTATNFQLVANSAIELARQGLSAEETLARVNSALVLSRLSGLDTVKSTEALTAAINSFNKEGITHEQIVNRMANVDASFAVSSADLAEAISRAGAVAQSSGVQFNELAAIVTAVQQRTARGGAVIGNGFKSIFTRIKRSRVRETLEDIGVATKNNDGSFRSSISILKDYAKVYQTLTDAQKSFTSEQIAGVFQIQNLQALIQDLNSGYSVFNRALGIANNTTNEATKRNAELNKTLSAAFTQTSLSAKELAASIGEIALSGNFKEILSFLNNLAQSFNEFLSEDKGSELGRSLVRGIGNFLTGPGLVILGAAFIKIFGLVGKFAKDAFSDLLGINKEAKRQQSLQAAIGATLSNNANLYNQILAASGNSVRQEQILLNLIKQETAERVKQEAMIKRMAASTTLRGIGAGESGFVPMGKRGTKKIGKKTLGLASGFLPAMNKEMSDINQGIGGARRGDKPVPMRINTAAGKSQQIVANTGEFVVKDFAGSGGDAIFNREMIKKFGLPKEAKKINVSSGFVPNFNKPGRPKGSKKAKEKLDFTKLVTMLVPTRASAPASGSASVAGTKFEVKFATKGPNKISGKRSISNSSNELAKSLIKQGAEQTAIQLSDGGKFEGSPIKPITNTEAGTTKGRIQEKAIASVLKSKVFRSDTATFDFLNPDVKRDNLFNWATPYGDAKPNRTSIHKNSIADKILRFFTPKTKGGRLSAAGVVKQTEAGTSGKLSKKVKDSIKEGIKSISVERTGRGRFSKASKFFSRASGFIPNLARPMGGSGKLVDIMTGGPNKERLKYIKGTASSLKYEGKDITFLNSQRKGDANLLFDRFMQQKGSSFSISVSPQRLSKKGSRTNFEDLIHAFPQLQYRLKDGYSTTGRISLPNGESFRFQSLKDLRDKVNKDFKRDEFRRFVDGKPSEFMPGVRKERIDIEDLTTAMVKGKGDNIYKSYAKGLIPNFAAGLNTKLGFLSTQRINRLKDGKSINLGDKKGLELKDFKEDSAAILGFKAVNSKENIAAAQATRKQTRNEMPTIDASRQATMLVATENFRKKVDTTFKKPDGTNFRLRYRAEGLKPSKLKGTEKRLRGRMKDLMISESTKLASDMSGAGKFSANNRPIKGLANAGSVGSAAGTIFETAIQSIGKNKLFTTNNAGFDISGLPDKKLQTLFGYYTPFADAKIGLSPDTKRDFNKKVINLPTSSKGMSSKDRKTQGMMALNARRKFGAPTNAAGGLVPALSRAFEAEKQFGGDPILDYNSKIGAYVRDRRTQKNFADVRRDHPEGMKKAIQNSRKMQGMVNGYIPNFTPDFLKKAASAVGSPFREGNIFGASQINTAPYQKAIDDATTKLEEQKQKLSEANQKNADHTKNVQENKERLKQNTKLMDRRSAVVEERRRQIKDYKGRMQGVHGGAVTQMQTKLDSMEQKLKTSENSLRRSKRAVKSNMDVINSGDPHNRGSIGHRKGNITKAQNTLTAAENRMQGVNQRQSVADARNQRMATMSMAAMFALPMISSSIRGNRDERELGAARGGFAEIADTASYGALFGVKGLAIAAGVGTLSAIGNSGQREIQAEMFEEIKASKIELDKIMDDTRAVDKLGQSIAQVQQSIETGNFDAEIKARDELSDSIASINNDELREQMEGVRDSSLSAAEKLGMVGDALTKLGRDSATTKAALELSEALSKDENIQSGTDEFLTLTRQRLVDPYYKDGRLFPEIRDAEGFMNTGEAVLNAVPVVSFIQDFSEGIIGSMFGKDSVESGIVTQDQMNEINDPFYGRENEALDLANRQILPSIEGALDKSTLDVADLLSGNKNFGDVFSSGQYGKEFLSLIKNVENLVKDEQGQALSSDVITERAKDSNLLSSTLKVIERMAEADQLSTIKNEIERRGTKDGTLDQFLRDNNFSGMADQLASATEVDGSVLRDALLKVLETETQKRDRLIQSSEDQLSKAGDRDKGIQDNLNDYNKVLERLASTQDTLALSMTRFNNNVELASQALEDMSSFLSSGNQFLESTGRISKDEALRREFVIRERTEGAESNIKLKSDLVGLVTSSIKVEDILLGDDMKKLFSVDGEGNKSSAPNTIEKANQLQQDASEEERKILAENFGEFIRLNSDGNITLKEIERFAKDQANTGRAGAMLSRQANELIQRQIRQNELSEARRQREFMLQQAQISQDRINRIGAGPLPTGEDLLQINDAADRFSRSDIERATTAQPGSMLLNGLDTVFQEAAKSIMIARDLEQRTGIEGQMFTGVSNNDANYIVAEAKLDQIITELRAAGKGNSDLAKSFEAAIDRLRDDKKKVDNTEAYIERLFEKFLPEDLELKLEPDSLITTNAILANVADKSDLMANHLGTVKGQLGKDGPITQSINNLANAVIGAGATPGLPATPGPLPPDPQDPPGVQNPIKVSIVEVEVIQNLTSSIQELPDKLKLTMEQVVFNHAIRGEVNFNFNNDVIEGMLGPVLMKQITEILSDAVILEALSKALKGFIDPLNILDPKGER